MSQSCHRQKGGKFLHKFAEKIALLATYVVHLFGGQFQLATDGKTKQILREAFDQREYRAIGMANTAQKSLVKTNSARLKMLTQIILATNVVFAVIRGGVFHSSFSTSTTGIWCFLCLLYAGPYVFLKSLAKPTYVEGNLVDGGGDLSGKGVVEYAHDTIYLTALAQIGCIFSPYSILLLAVIPVYATYAIVANMCSKSQADDSEEYSENDFSLSGLSRKERRKAERGRNKELKQQ